MTNYYIYNGRLYSEDELKHWKYISKKKVNGKWRYTYDDSIERNYEKAEKDYTTASLRKSAAEVNLDLNNKLAIIDDGFYSKSERKGYNERLKKFQAASKKYEAAGKKYIQAKALYKKTTVGRAIEKTISKAMNWLSNLFS